MKKDLKSLSYQQLEDYLKDEYALPSYKAKQIFKWLYRGVESFDEMTDISKELRARLCENAYINTLKTEKKLVSAVDGTVKFLFRLGDGEFVESVVMKYKYGYSICISSQVGCKMGCDFCASTLNGFKRNLTPAELIDQIIFAQKDMGIKISHVVMMGIGEPLDNFDNVMIFLYNVNNPDGLNISHRNISLSTCGLVDKINMLAEKKLGITLSISLHAPCDEIRNKIMPVSKKYGYDTLIEACKQYFDKTGRRISFEYILIDGLNDSEECAKMLSEKLSKMNCHVNLIPVNNVKEKSHHKSSTKATENFCKKLIMSGINATVRRTLGSDINASCGQLRNDSNSPT